MAVQTMHGKYLIFGVLESQAVTTTEGIVGICTLAAALGDGRETPSKNSHYPHFSTPKSADSNC